MKDAKTHGVDPHDSKHSAPPNETKTEATKDHKESNFPIVGIGASAGGLVAFEEFFAHMPTDAESGMAFVLVQHLDPDRVSILSDLVKRYTPMKVYDVVDGMEVEPNCAYIIPPNKDMAFLHGKLHLLQPAAPRGLRLPIDFFFRSLAQDQHERAICIVLSGTGTDGTLGLKTIKEAGGMAMVQDPQSAKYDGMPRSAIQTGLVDYILPPDKMPEQLIAYAQHAFHRVAQKGVAPVPQPTDALQKIFILLRAQSGHDFSHYKHNTIRRRIERRLAVNQIDRLDGYVRYLQQNPLELETLFRELLIGVTNFFRDPEAFEVLKQEIIPRLLTKWPPGRVVRIWVPGCSTGEEAYSIAMLLREHMDEVQKDFKVQIFATDIDSDAIEKARAGIYPDSIAADVSVERLARFFAQENGSYRIKKTIRDLVVFAEQNVSEDPPFSRIDVISCRNLLIYMGGELQKKVVRLFHYSLNQDGFLFLGNSETIGEFVDLFAAVNRKWKFYQRRGAVSQRPAMFYFPTPPSRGRVTAVLDTRQGEQETEFSIRELTEQALLESFTPDCAIINAQCKVLYFHGRTGKYLEPASGEASLNILHMAREGLRLELTNGIRKVIAQKVAVRYEGLQVKTNGETSKINLIVQPVTEPAALHGLIMVVFEAVTPASGAETTETRDPRLDINQRIAVLEQELRAKEEYLQTAIEELETSNEELKSTNEELQSSNEELQSTNEELETSKEELQSINEELVTVNTELQIKLDELSRVNNDMNNLLAGTGIGTVFVDHQLCIQRFTPAVTEVINLIQTDVGRPVGHIVSKLDYDHLVQDVQEVLDTLVPKEIEVQTREGQWFSMHILPYRTVENVIEGAVITFVDITEQKQVQEQLHQLTQSLVEARDFSERIVDTVREPLLVLDTEMRVLSANRSFYEHFQVNPKETLGQLLYGLGNQQWDIPELRRLLDEILPEKTSLENFEMTHDFDTIGRRTIMLNAREIRQKANKQRRILLAMQDITKS